MQEKEKQIEEMRYLADEMGKAISTELEKRYLADEQKLEEVLKANGWCKSTDLVEEIFAEIDTLIVRRMIPEIALIDDRLITDIAELKKKYKEGE